MQEYANLRSVLRVDELAHADTGLLDVANGFIKTYHLRIARNNLQIDFFATLICERFFRMSDSRLSPRRVASRPASWISSAQWARGSAR